MSGVDLRLTREAPPPWALASRLRVPVAFLVLVPPRHRAASARPRPVPVTCPGGPGGESMPRSCEADGQYCIRAKKDFVGERN